MSLGSGSGASDRIVNHYKAQHEQDQFTKAAEQQAASSQAATQAQTQANRPDQTNAFGSSVQWTQNPDGSWSQQQSFGGPLGGANQALLGQASQALATPFSFGGFEGDGSQARDQAIEAAYGQASSRLDPMFGQREERLKTQLLNQGLDPTSEAYRTALGDFERTRTDAYTSAMNSAIGQGREAGDSVFRNDMMAYQQRLADALRKRQLPLQELGQLQGFAGQQGFMGAGSAQATQYLPAQMASSNYELELERMVRQAEADAAKGATSLAGAATKYFIPKPK